MSRRRVLRNDYTKLPSVMDTTDGIDPAQFEKPKEKFPIKSAVLILGLMFGGTICLTLGFLIVLGYFGAEYEDRAWPLVLLGSIMFIPGSYYGWIIFCVLFKSRDYSVEDIPLF